MSPGEQMVFAVAFVDALAKVKAEDGREGKLIDEDGRAAMRASAVVDALKAAQKRTEEELTRLCHVPRSEWSEAQRQTFERARTTIARLEDMRGEG